MTGVALGSNAVTGFKAGIGDAVNTLQTSVNNQYLTEIAIMFIGLAVGIGAVLFFLKHHKKDVEDNMSLGSFDSIGEGKYAETHTYLDDESRKK